MNGARPKAPWSSSTSFSRTRAMIFKSVKIRKLEPKLSRYDAAMEQLRLTGELENSCEMRERVLCAIAWSSLSQCLVGR